jgi:biotin carboxylase
MIAAAAAIAKAFNLSGLFGLDYVRDRKGQVHLLEMNARATPTAHLMLGQDLPAALLQSAGLPARRREPVTAKTEVAIFPREWMRDPASPWLKKAYHDVPWNDPEVMRACIQLAQDQAPDRAIGAAPAQPEEGKSGILTTKSAGLRG